ncbi:MAG: GDYXXLXY domain-containing protein [Phycisphaeraceae bacterium]|nr:GDYXXLXY domain-containing protein [Phycisphaeraceae bacterium]
MTRKLISVSTFILLALIQSAVPLSMIARREVTLKTGRQFKFRTAPVDPYDAFRGRYVALQMEQASVKVAHNQAFARGQRVFVTLKQDEDGFTSLGNLTRHRPKEDPYLKVRVARVSGNDVRLSLPFDRYYMNEEDAPAAEAAYREHSRREEGDAHVSVRIRRGFAVLEELYIEGVPIEQYLVTQSD